MTLVGKHSGVNTMMYLARRFFISGRVGAFAAIAVYVLGSIPFVRTNVVFNPYLMLALAPASILGLAEPTSAGATVFLLGFVLLANFVLYGVAGLILCGVWSLFRRRTTV